MKRNTLLSIFGAAMLCSAAIIGTTGSSQEKETFADAPSVVSTTLVLSQVNGGGGGSTGTYLFDYVEIKNVSTTSQSLNGLSLYYGSATGAFASSASNAFELPNASIPAGGYYLVQLGTTGSAGAALPTPDATSGNLAMSGTSGKVALVPTASLAINACGSTATPCTTTQLAAITDWVAYGAAGNGTAGSGEGGTAVNNGVAITATQGAVRKNNGCQDTDNNNNDFDVVTAPVPKNSASAPISCSGATASPTPTPSPSPSPSPTATATPSGSPTPLPGALPKRLFTTRMSGAAEVPAVTTNGRGFGRVVLNAAETEITASFYWEGLSAGTTVGHIHTGAVTGTGPVTFDMVPTPGLTSGSTINKTFAITPAQVATLRAGGMYFNIHTSTNPGGEIRGQILSTTSDAPVDFNGDGRTDFSVVRPTTGLGGNQARWYNVLNATPATESQIDFGVISDSLTPGDFDGDGKDDIAVWRAATDNSNFFILQSSTNTVRQVRFGIPNDDPFLIADYDGDGIDDPAIYRAGATPTSQSQFWWFGSFGTTRNVQVVVNWGVGSDTATPGDYNGDGKADFMVYRDVGGRGVSYIHYGTGGFDATSANDTATRFGLPLDTFVPGDWDGDGATDLSVSRFEGANLAWYNLPSSNTSIVRRLAWGRNGPDLEAQGDFDGDGRTDHAVWRTAAGTTGLFFILRSSDSVVQYQFWGLLGDALVNQDTHNQ